MLCTGADNGHSQNNWDSGKAQMADKSAPTGGWCILLINPMCLFFWNLIAALFALIFLCGCTFGRLRLPNVQPHKKKLYRLWRRINVYMVLISIIALLHF